MIGGINDLTIVDNGNVELSYEKKGHYIYDKTVFCLKNVYSV